MLRLIIIDDEREIRYGLENYFPWAEFDMEVCGSFSNAREAIDYVRKEHVDVVLTDIRMPGMSGIEMITELKKIDPEIRFVVISGYRDFSYAVECMKLGVKDYLLKPAKYEDLKKTFLSISQDAHSKRDRSDEDAGLSPIERTKKYINSNLKEASLEGAANYVQMNQYYLSFLFHDQTGERFIDYIQRVRMEKAKKLLEEGSMSANDIAVSIGYTNANSFSRAFKNYYGLTPKEFKTK